jgi:hypothetical protein
LATLMPASVPEAPQDAGAPQADSGTPNEATSEPDGAEIANDVPFGLDPLADYAWRERGLGVAAPLTWAQRRTMRRLITQGKAEPLPMAEQRCWVSADLLWCLSGATRVIVKPDGTRVLR